MSEQDKTIEVPKSEDELVFEQMNASLDQIKQQREELAKALLETAKTTKLNPSEDAPRITEVKLALFNAADSILKSQESLQVTKAKMSLAKKSEATSDNVKQIAIEVLKNINMKHQANAPVETSQDTEDALKQAFDAALKDNPDISIKEDELQIDEH